VLTLAVAVSGCAGAPPKAPASAAVIVAPSVVMPAPSADASSQAPAAVSSANEIAREVASHYAKSATFRATFKQRYYTYDRVKDATGSVIFERPGKMSWRYTTSGNRVVSDGTLIKIYEKENKQVYELQPAHTQFPAAFSFLGGSGRLEDNFRLSRLESQHAAWYVLAGTPSHPTKAFERVFFFVNAQTYQVERVIFVDSQGNRNRFDLAFSAFDHPVPEGEFAFTPPPGTQVIRP
jgi:outer membrane lipoprotein carrier protein